MRSVLIILLFLFSSILSAKNKIDSLETILPHKEGLDKVKILNDLAHAYWNTAPDKGLYYANKAYEIAVKYASKKDIAKAIQNRGLNYWAKSELRLALESHLKSLEIYEEIADTEGICHSYSNIGIAYTDLSNYENALEYSLKALKIAEENEFPVLQIRTLANISTIYIVQQNNQEALKYVQASIELSDKHGDNSFLAVQLNMMGQIYENQEDYIKARSTYKRTLQIDRKTKNNYGCTISLYNVGNAEYHLKNYDSALKYFNESLILSKEIKDQIGVFFANKSIGLVHMKQNRFEYAQSYFKTALDLANNLDLKEEKLDIYQNYYELYKSMGSLEKSLRYLESFISLNDSIYSENSAKQIAEMQTKYDTEKKDKENILLRKNNEIQTLAISKQTSLRNSFIALSILVLIIALILYSRFKIRKNTNIKLFRKNNLIEEQKAELIKQNNILIAQYEKVKVLNATKDKFFKIISHDLKTPFTSILGFSDLLKSRYPSMDDSRRMKMIDGISQSSKFAYELLTNLLTWAQSQTGEIKIIKEELSLNKLIETCVSLYGQGAVSKNINVTTNIPENIKVILDKDTSMIFIGNLINNAIKYTPNKGTVSIKALELKENIRLFISDNGVGMTPTVVKNLFRIDESTSTLGTNNENGTGLGLILCKEFIDKNECKIEVSSKVGTGSEFTISIPKNTY